MNKKGHFIKFIILIIIVLFIIGYFLNKPTECYKSCYKTVFGCPSHETGPTPPVDDRLRGVSCDNTNLSIKEVHNLCWSQCCSNVSCYTIKGLVNIK